jgi:hypothetical protein
VLQPLLQPLALGHVGLDAQPVEGLALLVVHQGRLVPDPNHRAVPGDLPVLQRRRVPRPVGALVLGQHPLPVVRVEDLDPVSGLGEGFLSGVALDRLVLGA